MIMHSNCIVLSSVQLSRISPVLSEKQPPQIGRLAADNSKEFRVRAREREKRSRTCADQVAHSHIDRAIFCICGSTGNTVCTNLPLRSSCSLIIGAIVSSPVATRGFVSVFQDGMPLNLAKGRARMSHHRETRHLMGLASKPPQEQPSQIRRLAAEKRIQFRVRA